MTAAVDFEKLSKVLALAGSDQDGEALAALRKAGGMLKAAGLSFTDLGQKLKAGPAQTVQTGQAQHSPQPQSNGFPNFDDWMEKKEPGWRAQQADKRAAKSREQAVYRAAVLEKYDSAEAAIGPCWRETQLRKALGSLVSNMVEPYARWTDHIGAIRHCSDFFGFEKVPSAVRAAIEGAFPMPTTIAEALAEYERWREREREIEAALNCNAGDTAPDLVCFGRMELVRMLLEYELPARDLSDLLFRSRYYRSLQSQCDRIDEALHRDLERLAAAPPSNLDTSAAPPSTASARRRAVLDMLSNPNTAALSDREIARRAGVSPSTVGALRKAVVESRP